MTMPVPHYPKYFWHPKIHEQWAGESLHYYRFGFLPKLDKDVILRALRNALEKRGITSYSWNETYGSIDIVLRLWLRPEHRPEVIHTDLLRALSAEGITCRFADSFHVEKIVSHWRWPDVDLPPLDRELVEDVNLGRRTKITKRALAEHLIRSYNGRDGRIHFYIGIPSQHSGTEIKQVIPARILRRYGNHNKVRHLAIYLGTGGAYDIFVEADVANGDYDAIAGISDFLNELGCLYGVKTETHLVTGSTKTSFYIADILSVSREIHRKVEHRSYQAYASAEEDDTLEKKGTTFTDFHRYLETGEKHRDPNYLKEGPLKTMVGMLHSRGGEIIVGLLEDRKLPKDAPRRLTAFEKIDDFYVIGVEQETNYKTWDDYEQQLRNHIDTLISPRLGGTGLFQISRIPAGNCSLALITVYPAQAAEWYAIAGKVYIRDGNRTIPVTAVELPRYQEHRKRQRLEDNREQKKKKP
jgi:hypothetical protein